MAQHWFRCALLQFLRFQKFSKFIWHSIDHVEELQAPRSVDDKIKQDRCRICGWDKTCMTLWTHLVNRENFTKQKIRVLNKGMPSAWSHGNKGDANVLDLLVIFSIVKLICTNMVIFWVLFVMHKDRLSNAHLGNCLVYCASSFKV
jgi:hypothetical protein